MVSFARIPRLRRLILVLVGTSAMLSSCGTLSTHENSSHDQHENFGTSSEGPKQRIAGDQAAHKVSPNVSILACDSWLNGTLLAGINSAYGEINDCDGVLITPASGEWVVTTDEGATGVGSIGIYVCASGDCSSHFPTNVSDLTWYQPNTTAGTYNRYAGVNDDDTLLFTGGDVNGEMALDVATGTFDAETNHD